MFKFINAIIYITIEFIGIAFFNQGRDHSNNIFDMCRNTRINVSMLYTKGIHYFEIAVDITICNSIPRYAFTIGCIDDFVIHISKVLYICYFIAYMFHIATNYVPSYKWTCIANVRMVIWCNTTYVHLCLTWCYRVEHLFLARHSIINCNFSHRYRCLHLRKIKKTPHLIQRRWSAVPLC